MGYAITEVEVGLIDNVPALSEREAASFASCCRWAGYSAGQFSVTVVPGGSLIRVIERRSMRERLYRDYTSIPWLESFERDLQNGLFSQSWESAYDF